MPRPLRIEYPNAWYHVMNRGAGRRKIFLTDAHRTMFLNCLAEACEMFNTQIHAYCLMDNHYHLLIRTPDANLGRVMRHINGVYTQRYNRMQRTDGPLFRGRYKAQIIDEDCYLLLVSRYIHLNPTSAKMVDKPNQFKWSSYKAYLHDKHKPDWLCTALVKKRLARTKSLKHFKDYRDYVENHDIDELAVFTSKKYTSPILGSEEFKTRLLEQVDDSKQVDCATDFNRARLVPTIKDVMRVTMGYFDISLEQLTQSKRGQTNLPKLICLYLCRKKFGYGLGEIAAEFGGISRNTVGSAVGKFALLLVKDVENAGLVDGVFERLA